ncbi:MAG: DUF1326 domain-containing protein [Acidobacteriota bacterium]
MEACNCKAACPCIFLSAPTEGECTAVVGWHIDKGNLGEVDLAGFNVAMAVYSPGEMHIVKWRVALYVDAKASESQKNALVHIFSGQAGGHPARLGSHIGEVLGVASVPIEYSAKGRHRSLKVGSVANAEIEAVSGAGENEVTVTNHPLCISPGYPAVVAKSTTLRYEDYGYQWTLSERNGLFSPFTYQG